MGLLFGPSLFLHFLLVLKGLMYILLVASFPPQITAIASISFLCISPFTVLDINTLKSCTYYTEFRVFLGDVLTGTLICQRDKRNVRALNVTISLLTRKLKYIIS